MRLASEVKMPKLKTCGNNDECDEWHEGLIPEWDGSMPQRKTDYKTLKQAAEAIGGGD
tara:strand:+ start:25 stop:198 length:174 start_codon:yes stop_codon:yes gene_type:complete